MGNRSRDAARAHEDAQDAVAGARAARERSEQIALEVALRRERAGNEPLRVDPETEAVLRAHLRESPPDGDDAGDDAEAAELPARRPPHGC